MKMYFLREVDCLRVDGVIHKGRSLRGTAMDGAFKKVILYKVGVEYCG